MACRVEVEAAGARQREAELTVRLDVVEAELAEAAADLETEKTKRLEAERAAAGYVTAIDQMRWILADLPAGLAAEVPTAGIAVESASQETSSAEATSEVPASATGRGTTLEASSAGDNAQPAPGAAATERTVSITVELPEEEAAALDAHAARAGFPDGQAFAVDLIREGLRRGGMLPPKAQGARFDQGNLDDALSTAAAALHDAEALASLVRRRLPVLVAGQSQDECSRVADLSPSRRWPGSARAVTGGCPTTSARRSRHPIHWIWSVRAGSSAHWGWRAEPRAVARSPCSRGGAMLSQADTDDGELDSPGLLYPGYVLPCRTVAWKWMEAVALASDPTMLPGRRWGSAHETLQIQAALLAKSHDLG